MKVAMNQLNDMDSSFVLSESDSSSCSDFDSNDHKNDTKKAQHLLFSGRL